MIFYNYLSIILDKTAVEGITGDYYYLDTRGLEKQQISTTALVQISKWQMHFLGTRVDPQYSPSWGKWGNIEIFAPHSPFVLPMGKNGENGEGLFAIFDREQALSARGPTSGTYGHC